MPLPGDWICGSCQYLNYFWRRTCRRCNEPVIGQNRILKFGSNPRNFNFRPGDWFCDAGFCRAHNFARRRMCYKCGARKSMLSFGGSIGYYNSVFPPMTFGFHCQRVGRLSRHHHRGWRVGDWFCGRAGCNAHNYGARVQCFRSSGCHVDEWGARGVVLTILFLAFVTISCVLFLCFFLSLVVDFESARSLDEL